MQSRSNLNTEIIINLTDWEPLELLSSFEKQRILYENARLEVGSYLCGNYFRHFCRSFDASSLPQSYDLVLPVLAQHDLSLFDDDRVQALINQAQNIVVNDPGTLMRFSNLKVRLGRLFFRTYRDHRYHNYEQSMVQRDQQLSLISALKKVGAKFNAAECELIGEQRENDPFYYYHYPFRLISAMRICEYASQSKAIERKFIPDAKCSFQCLNSCIHYQDHAFQNNYIKWGRGLYDRAFPQSLEGFNLIIMPELF